MDDIDEVERIAELVKTTQPRWSANLKAVCSLARERNHYKAEWDKACGFLASLNPSDGPNGQTTP